MEKFNHVCKGTKAIFMFLWGPYFQGFYIFILPIYQLMKKPETTI